MAHFAELDENNKVVQVIVIHNNELLDNGVESEAKGIAFCKSLYGEDTNWVQTSYNKTIRKNYASVDFIYDPIADHFFPPSPSPSWVLDEDAQWKPPIPYPTDGKTYTWNEDKLEWVEVIVGK
jgi:hypothetical protein